MVRDSLVNKLIKPKKIKGAYLTFDSYNIPVKVKENNLKTATKERFNKSRKSKGDILVPVLVSWSISPNHFKKRSDISGVTGILSSQIPYLNYPLQKKPREPIW